MAKNFQLVHILGSSRPSTKVYAGIGSSNKELVTVKVTDFDELKDNGALILVSYEINFIQSLFILN